MVLPLLRLLDVQREGRGARTTRDSREPPDRHVIRIGNDTFEALSGVKERPRGLIRLRSP